MNQLCESICVVKYFLSSPTTSLVDFPSENFTFALGKQTHYESLSFRGKYCRERAFSLTNTIAACGKVSLMLFLARHDQRCSDII
jgi:hypothetical protein